MNGSHNTAQQKSHGSVHVSAIVHPDAILGAGTTVGAYSIIGPDVVLGENNVIGPHVVIEGRTRLGNSNKIFQFASVGADPQDLKFCGELSELLIGDNNIIREFTTLQPGTTGGGMVTRIGNGNLFMANTHVGHDTIIGNKCIFANSAALSGHVTIGDRVVVGGLSGIHQFVKLGDLSMIGAGAMVAQDIPPFCMAQGDRAKLIGLNKLGLERAGVSKEAALALRKVYRLVLLSESEEVKGLTIKERIAKIKESSSSSPQIEQFLSFVLSSERGVARPRSSLPSKDGDE